MDILNAGLLECQGSLISSPHHGTAYYQYYHDLQHGVEKERRHLFNYTLMPEADS